MVCKASPIFEALARRLDAQLAPYAKAQDMFREMAKWGVAESVSAFTYSAYHTSFGETGLIGRLPVRCKNNTTAYIVVGLPSGLKHAEVVSINGQPSGDDFRVGIEEMQTGLSDAKVVEAFRGLKHDSHPSTQDTVEWPVLRFIERYMHYHPAYQDILGTALHAAVHPEEVFPVLVATQPTAKVILIANLTHA